MAGWWLAINGWRWLAMAGGGWRWLVTLVMVGDIWLVAGWRLVINGWLVAGDPNKAKRHKGVTR